MPMRVMLLGATGTIGQATARALVARGHEVVCLVRPQAGVGARWSAQDVAALLPGTIVRTGDPCHAESLRQQGFKGERFDALVSCMASRTGVPRDAWAVDHAAHVQALQLARDAGVSQMVLLSAICVQKPLLAFQQAKLAFESELMQSGISWSIVRPTAFFKSLAGQVKRLKKGKPYLMFGNGELTACKPIGDNDLALYLARCLEEEDLRNRILPIGGPGPALTPLQMGQCLFRLLGQEPRYTRVPVALLDVIIAASSTLGLLLPRLAEKAELARIGRYYATESMLVLDPASGRYSADATPSTGTDTLPEFYSRLISGEASADRGDHAVF